MLAMNAGEFRSSINQLESDLTNSRKKLHEKFEKLKSDFEELQQCIVEKNEQIAVLKDQKKDLLSLLDQAFAIIDDPSEGRLLEDLRDVESEVRTLIGIAKCDQPSAAEEKPADGGASIKLTKSEPGKAEPGEQAKKWAKAVLKGVGETARAGSAGPSRS